MRLGPEAPDASAIAHLLDVIMNGVARNDRTAEACLVYRHEIDERRILELFDVAHAKRAGGLRHAFDEEHARHNRIARKMALEVRLVRGHVLDAGSRAVPVHVDDAIDKEEWVTMRQKLEDVRDLSPSELRFHSAFVHKPWLLRP